MSIPSPLVSVLVPAYNGARYLPELCESIQAQTYPNFEVVILDDGSTDQTRSVLSIFEKDPRFKVTGWTPNRGLAATLRELLVLGRGDFWVGIGQDDRLFPDFLERRLALMQAHPDAVILHGPAEIIDESGKTIPSPFPPWNFPAYVDGRRGLEILLQHNIINASSALVRYDATRKILPYYHCDWEFVQDWHLWILLIAGGGGLLWNERPANNYRVHGQSISKDPGKKAVRRADLRLMPLCVLKEASRFSLLAADYSARWRKTLYRLWLLRALKMRCQGVLQDKWLQTAGQAYYGDDHPRVSLLTEYLKHGAGVAVACLRERRALGRQPYRVSGLAEINDPVFR